MAVPSVVNVIPARGPTAGRGLVEVFGDGFSVLVPAESPGGPAPAPVPTVEVLFDGVAAHRVAVPLSNRLIVEVPPSPIAPAPVIMAGSPALTFAASGPDTITRDSGSWIDDGFRAGMRVLIVRSDSNDDSWLLIASVSALVLTFDASVSLVAEGPTADVAVRSNSYGEGAVALTIRNLDSLGEPVPGEEVVVPDAYTYERVQLGTESDLTRICRELIRQVRLQVIPNAAMTENTDFDASVEDRLNTAGLAAFPAVVLIGPTLGENRVLSTNEEQEVTLASGEVQVRRAPFTIDLDFGVLLVSNNKVESINLMGLWLQFVDRNHTLALARDPNDASLGVVEYELDVALGSTLVVDGQKGSSNLRSASGTLIVRGFDLEDLAGFADEKVVDVTAEVGEAGVTLNVSQTGVSYAVGPSPGGL